MKKPTLKLVALSFSVFALGVSVQAASFINSFDAPFDYVANGIIGDTNWDGVYLGFGDVAGGNAGGNGNGNTLQANTTAFGGGYLGIQSTGGGWGGAEDDGFFIYKVVRGDFDASVDNMPATFLGGTAYDDRANNFSGLMIRAYHTNNSGAPFSTTLATPAENFVLLWRFNQFAIDGQVRISTNGVNAENTYVHSSVTNADTDTSSIRGFRITRTGNRLNFFVRRYDVGASPESWLQVTNFALSTNLVRTDWEGIALQVGIAQAPFSTASRDAFFDNFELSGPNVTFPAQPSAPSNLTITPVNSYSVKLAWTPGAGSGGSLVVVRANGKLIANPIQGSTYTADSNFTNPATLLEAGGNHVVYVGSGADVIVTGLGGSNNTYNAAVYSYSGVGSATAYNTASPATNSTIGPGQVSSVSFTVSPTNIPAGGVSVATVTATYNSGDSYNVSADPNTVWVSSDPTVIVAANGLLSGLTNGSSTITATYAGVTGTNIVSVYAPAFVDEFSSNHDYATNGVTSSRWDGLYLGAGDVPLQIAGNLGPQPGVTTVADANMSSNNLLTVTHRQTGWEGNESDGFFLFKQVPGDFQVAVHIHSYDAAAFHMPGLMARLFTPAGGPAGTTSTAFPNGRENHVRWSRFDEFNISTTARRNQNGANQVSDQVDGDTAAFWLLMVRTGTTFTFYKKVNAADGWSPVPGSARTLANATNGAAMQVGLGASTFDSGANFRTVRFEHFMLDAANLNVATPLAGATNLTAVANNDGTMTLSWTPATGSAGTMVVMRPSGQVNVQPINGVTYTASNSFGLGSNLGSSNYIVYSGSGGTVTVSNLVPSTTYHSAAYAYYTPGPGVAYSLLNVTVTNKLAIGALQSVVFSVPGSKMLLNGGVGGFYSVKAIYAGGVTNDVTSAALLESNPPGAVAGTNGVLSALTNGVVAVTVSASYSGQANSQVFTTYDPAYRNDFSVTNDFVAKLGVAGTTWDGVYFGGSANDPNSIPGVAGGANGTTLVCDANSTRSNALTVSSTMTDWAGAANDGFLLHKYVAGDFQMAVRVASIDRAANGTGGVANQFAGLMARAFGTNGSSANLTGTNAAENWVYYGEFERFNDSTESRFAINGVDNELPLFDGATNDFWLLLVRQNGTNFTCYRKVNAEDPWIPQPNQTLVQPNLVPGVPLQVGLFQALYSANTGTVQFENFMLDALPPKIQASNAGGNVELQWPAVPDYSLQRTLSLNPTNWLPLGGAPVFTNNAQYLLTLPITNAQSYFRLAK